MSGGILVVDDEREIADLVEGYLQNDGYTVFKAYNADDALAAQAGTIPNEILSRLGARLARVVSESGAPPD